MAVVAALATALAAVAAAFAGGGYHLGSLHVPPALYAMALLPAVVAVSAGRRPPAAPKLKLPPATVRILLFALIGAGLVVSAKGVPDGTSGAVTTLSALAVAALSYWWPLPAFLRTSVALAAVAGLGPGSRPGDHVPALAFLGASAAVALVACNRLATADRPVLGDRRPRVRPHRMVGEAALVALALAVGALLASRMDPSTPPPSQARPGAEPLQQQPAPLAYQDVLDPNAAGEGRRGGDRDEVLLRVDADRPGVLRAITYDEWDGRRWLRSQRLRATEVPEVRFVPLFNDRYESEPASVSEQRIRVEASYAGVAVGTPRVYFYEVPGRATASADGTVLLFPALGKGAVYTAQSGRVETTPAQLRAAGTDEVLVNGEGGQVHGRDGADPAQPPTPISEPTRP